ncbi:unnamed protein product [Closterium sp. NIES-64]|nr:unnamed protein product [Closterium sp. NIES-65]CAI5970945.1 unnamed protein product [Closterium sp. NIES-65]CAI5972018.1 unnamed protein product [Closterium sp. NIES-64]
MTWSDYGMLAASIGLPIGQGFLSATLFGGGDSPWYRSLDKPSWTPPGWVFPVVWINLYIMMGVAAWLVWLQGGFSVQALPLGFYLFQLLLNFLWTPLFFGMRKIDWALAEIVLLWLSVFSTIVLFWPVSKLASILLWPYIVWASIATSLNWYIFLHNAPTPGADGLAQPLRASD